MKIAICEDDAVLANQLRRDVEQYFFSAGLTASIALFSDGTALSGANEEYDLLFMDCRLPDGNGVELAQTIKQSHPSTEIIFVSAYVEYLFDSYAADPFRFLIKPIDSEKLNAVLDAFLVSFRENKPVLVMTDLSIPMDEIILIEIRGNNTCVVTRDTVFNSRRKLSEFEKELSPACFIRPHKSHIINLAYVKGHRDNRILLSNGQSVPVSRRNKSVFLRAYVRYLNSHR